MTYAAAKRYASFININKHNDKHTVAELLSYDNKSNLCIYVAADGISVYIIPIRILISDIYNNITHIKKLSMLKNWFGWESPDSSHDMYPSDYFDNTDIDKDPYVIDITAEYDTMSATDLYRKYKDDLSY